MKPIIYLVSAALPPDRIGGGEVVLLQFAQRAQEAFDVTILAGNYGNAGITRETTGGIDFIRLPVAMRRLSKRFFLGLAPPNPQAFRGLRRLPKPAAVVLFGFPSLFHDVASLVFRDVPRIWIPFAIPRRVLKHPRLLKLYGAFSRPPDVVVAATRRILQGFGQLWPLTRSVELPLGLELTSMLDFPWPHPQSSSETRLVMAGRIARTKRFELGIQAVAWLRLNGVAARLTIVGPREDPDYAKQLVGLSQRLGVANQVKFSGYVSQDEKITCFRESHVFLSTSADEGFGLSVVEAMALRIPVVATWTRGFEAIIRPGENAVIATDAPEAIGRAITEVTTDLRRQDYLTERGFESARQFRWESVFPRYKELLNETIQRK
ncbi:MAG: glycosyltransferase family 4 protein [Euryarchaeota archaeon]|nr:glycosyltransferase family 4 protein [Euryarchaeota archaeon]